jgi:hypothetical protein
VPDDPPRITREKRTLRVMLELYCRAHHAVAPSGGNDVSPARGQLCVECQPLLDYALCRLDRCPFGAEKPTCANCPIHCYKPLMRTRVQTAMRYAGPRMLFRHPILALFHLWDGRRTPPETRRE